MTAQFAIALHNGLAKLPDQKPKCKHCKNPRYKDSEYCYPHMVAEERANE